MSNLFTNLNDNLKPNLKRTAAFVVTCSVIASTTLSVNAMSNDYCVVDGQSVTYVSALSNNTDRVLDRAGVALNNDDTYTYDNKTNTITVMRAFDTSVKDVNGNYYTYRTNRGTVADALKACNVTLGANDTVSPSLSTPLTSDMGTITVSHWNNVTVNIDGEPKTLKVATGTVLEQALKSANLGIDDDDIVSVDKNTIVVGDMALDVNRATVEEQTSVAPVAYGTVTKETSSLPKGQTQVETPGVNGERVVTNRITTIDGEVAAIEELSSTQTKAPSDEVVLVGTATTGNASSSPSFGGGNGTADGVPVEYSSLIQATCTAYTGGGTCSTGVPAAYGYVAVNPNQIPYGTRMYICSPDGSVVYGYAIAADTGGAMMSGSAAVDLYFDTQAECAAFGRRTMNIYIL